MRDLIVTENITLDGVIDAAGGWFATADDARVDQSDLVAALRDQSARADAVLFGRVTFEQMRGYWPRQADDTSGVSKYLDSVSKYVVSKTLGEPEWQHSTVLRGPMEDEVRALKARPGRDIVCTGSITLVRDLIAAGLVEEYRLFVHPVVLGRGERLFADAPHAPKLRVVETRQFRSGVVLLQYRAD
jgi:dihydrofolate reductase